MPFATLWATSSTGEPDRTGHRPTARWRDSTGPWPTNGPTPGSTPATPNDAPNSPSGCTPTITTAATPHSEANHPPAAYPTSQASTLAVGRPGDRPGPRLGVGRWYVDGRVGQQRRADAGCVGGQLVVPHLVGVGAAQPESRAVPVEPLGRGAGTDVDGAAGHVAGDRRRRHPPAGRVDGTVAVNRVVEHPLLQLG